MKLNKFKYSLLALCLGASACDIMEPLDELKPKYQLVEENTYTDAAKVEAALNGIYAGWRTTGTWYHPGNLMALSGNYTQRLGSAYELNNVPTDHRDNKSAYSSYYKMIQRSSFLIDNLVKDTEITSLSDERRLEVEGEARLSRAMCHFALLECYGQFYDMNSEYGIVVIKTASRELITPPRNTVKETYEAIVEDLDFAIANAPVKSAHYKFSQTVAKAWKAKVLLYMGDYANAAALAMEVMNDANYGLELNYETIFSKGYNSKEVLFSPLITYTERTSVLVGTYYPVGNIKNIADAEVADEVDGDGEIVKNYDLRYEFTHIDGIFLGRPNQKYAFNLSKEGDQGNSLYNMRLAEVYLIYAEAKARLANSIGDGDAVEAIAKLNEIRDRAGMPDKAPATIADLLEAIRIEKSLELHNEMGQPWFDMVRYFHDDIATLTAIKSTITSKDQLVLPIPKSALAGNKALVQNPGY
jgi:hypothetical protein